jgi:DNA-binding response OmpR family regulator
MAGSTGLSILALGQFKSEERAVVEAAAQRVGATLHSTMSAKTGWRMLKEVDPDAVLVETAAVGADKLCQVIRNERRWQGIPIVGLPRDLNDRIFAKAYSWGVDDLVRLGDWSALERRLHCIQTARPTKGAPEHTKGDAVVADADPARCGVMGRVLASAGFKVRVATDLRTLLQHSHNSTTRLVVVNSNVGDVESVLLAARKRNPEPTWVIATPARDIERWASKIADFERVGVTSASGTPENVVFFANELMNKRSHEARSQARNLYGTTVAFRSAGDAMDEFGFSYNVCPAGLYVRSLLCVAGDELWLEVRPPRSDRLVRLCGRVVWNKPLGVSEGHGTPPGFAIRITGGLGQGVQLWAEGCQALEAGGKRRSASLRPNVIGLGPLEAPEDTLRPSLPEIHTRGVGHAAAATSPGAPSAADETAELEETLQASVTSPPAAPRRTRRSVKLAVAGATLVAAAAAVLFGLPSRHLQRLLPAVSSGKALAGAPVDHAAPAAKPPSAATQLVNSVTADGPAGEPALNRLQSDQGLLQVIAPVKAQVFVQGTHVGATGDWLRAQCGTRQVRLASEQGHFIEPGRELVIPCGGSTRIQVALDP